MNLKTFKRGIHPAYHKELSASKPSVRAKIPKKIVIPLRQHIGAPCDPLVKRGDVVEEGQKIGEVASFVSAPIHSSVAGKVKSVDMLPFIGGGKTLSVTVETAEDFTPKVWDEGETSIGLDLEELTRKDIRDSIREAGIIGMGGAAFPTSVKLNPPKDVVVDAVILNGCECEPYLSADHRTMVEFPEKVLWGLRAIMKTLAAKEAYIGIEDNKTDAIEAITRAASGIIPELTVVALETKYPQGAEKMLIKAVLGRTVPVGKLPFDSGVLVQNVGTAFAIYESLKYKKPLIERILTVSGNGVAEPKNLIVRNGTLLAELIDQCGGFTGDKETVVLSGGPMMGISQMTLDVGAVKGTSGITVLTADRVKPVEFQNCIRCAECINVCPMGLMPFKLGDMGRLSMTDDFDAWAGMSCIECGCCSFICPSKRPLVHWIRLGKLRLREAAKGSAA
ncbi:MAG: electron transport complex subunit RsxC [Thermodesulfobacteriota bacterium]